MEAKRDGCRILVEKREGRRPLGRPKCRWEDTMKMDIREIGWGIWIALMWLRIGSSGGLL
jgi:hypothetical protein